MITIKGFVWDEWNKGHVTRHNVSPEEIEEVCHGSFKAVESYRKRILVSGKTKKGRKLVAVLSPEDRNFNRYQEGIYYPITAFEEEV